MLVRLLPEQVVERWSEVAPQILKSLPIEVQLGVYTATNILRSILAEDAQCWYYFEEDDFEEPAAVLVTTVRVDMVSGSRSLLVYSLVALKPLSRKLLWVDGMEQLLKYAASVGCHNIIAYTNIPKLAEVLETLGWSAEFQVLEAKV